VEETQNVSIEPTDAFVSNMDIHEDDSSGEEVTNIPMDSDKNGTQPMDSDKNGTQPMDSDKNGTQPIGYAHSYLFQRVSDTNFKKHYDKHGWAISDYVFDSKRDANNVLIKVLNGYKSSEVRGLLQWHKTAGNGTRAWASMDGNVTIENLFVPRIRDASQGLITGEYKKDKVAFLKGGQGIQAPHYDGNPNAKSSFDAAVSVNYACYEETYFVVYDKNSIKEIEDGKFSIDYKRVYVPKGKAIYFDAYRCLHGGDDYSKTEIERRNVFGTEHLRFFSRFILGASENDFFPPQHFDVYICTETIRDYL
jgi:hypothetical protein